MGLILITSGIFNSNHINPARSMGPSLLDL